MYELSHGTIDSKFGFFPLSSAIDTLQRQYPHRGKTALELLARVNISQPHLGPNTPGMVKDLPLALPWLTHPKIEVLTRPCPRYLERRLAKGLFDSFRESSLGLEIWPRDDAAYAAARQAVLPLIARLDSSLQGALQKIFGTLTEAYALTFFSFVMFKACRILLSSAEREPEDGFAPFLNFFERGIHIPGLDADGAVLVLVG